VGSRTGTDVVEKRKIPSPRRESNPDRSQSLYGFSYPGSEGRDKLEEIRNSNK